MIGAEDCIIYFDTGAFTIVYIVGTPLPIGGEWFDI